ncbi:hypothetical protein I7X12_15000 [Halosimplex litoreum]|uniref:Deferrochelatase/peroxidase EfeB n=1 Tax=Halosimplex litoreum TaxID=1198301 RepID=A0A7T3FWY2_9EURY|nr:hypothetical protein [Halosimplex litoreum]QPV62047.1 hypothetical protein I7X12_15000 [Halosimplex litoreum]
MSPDNERGIGRREFVATAVAIGGASALSACQERERDLVGTESDGPSEPEGAGGTRTGTDTEFELSVPTGNPDALSKRQHAWNYAVVHDAHGNTVIPQQQLILGLSYEGSTPPTEAEREQVEGTLRTLEEAFQWGTGGNPSASFTQGLLFMLGYSASYFERTGGVPEQLVPAEDLLRRVGEDPDKADDFDAVLLMNSDIGSVVMAAEAALFGEIETINGVEVTDTFEGVFSKTDRRTGMVGKGIPADVLDNDSIPESAPLSMGFKSGYRDSQPSEDRITIREGPFAGGTTMAISRLGIDLDRWYDQSHEERAAEMFCPAHDTDEIGEIGEKLGAESRITEENARSVEEYAEEYDRVGHTQKVARARDDDFVPTILRRSEGVATDAAQGTEFNFSGLQRHVDDFVETRKAMNTDEYDDDLAAEDHGIVDYLETLHRETLLVPPRSQRALPTGIDE